MAKLTELEEKFCLKYFETGNGLQSVLDAGYNQTTKAAAVTSTRLLKKANIQARLSELRSKQEKRTEITADRVLKELASLAFLDLGKFYNENGKLLNVQDIPEEARRALAGIKVYDEFDGFGPNKERIGETTEVKTYDKTRALELLGKHLKLFTEKLEHSGPDGKAIELKNLTELPDDQLEERIKLLYAKTAAKSK